MHASTAPARLRRADLLEAESVLGSVSVELDGRRQLRPKSVWLFVSKDRGATWQQISDAKPQVLAFNYRAEADGEYWFAIRTTDASGRDATCRRARASGAMQPELRVIVDTTMPRFESLSGQLRNDGTLEIRWRVTDANLDAHSCNVEVQADALGELAAGAARRARRKSGSATGKGWLSFAVASGAARRRPCVPPRSISPAIGPCFSRRSRRRRRAIARRQRARQRRLAAAIRHSRRPSLPSPVGCRVRRRRLPATQPAGRRSRNSGPPIDRHALRSIRPTRARRRSLTARRVGIDCSGVAIGDRSRVDDRRRIPRAQTGRPPAGQRAAAA